MALFRYCVTCSLVSWLMVSCSNGSSRSGNSGTIEGLDGATTCGTSPSAVGDYPCDVGTVIQNRCQECHQDPPLHGAHFSLLRFEDTQQPFGVAGMLRWQRMAQVIEPDAIPHMPYQDAGQLTVDELETLRNWFKSCAPPAPEGQGCDKGE